MVLPQRITANLTRMLKRYHTLRMKVHCTHPDELTIEPWRPLRGFPTPDTLEARRSSGRDHDSV